MCVSAVAAVEEGGCVVSGTGPRSLNCTVLLALTRVWSRSYSYLFAYNVEKM